MEFTKMHGCGNDYIYFDCTRQPMDRDLASQLAVRLSDRHFGIGGDGIILIEKGQNADFEMVMYNADGSRGAMCGNGIRCVAKYVYDHKLTDKTTVTIASMGAVKTIDIQVQDGVAVGASVDMGAPILDPAAIPVVTDCKPPVDVPITVHDTVYKMTCVSMGNPHAVVFIDHSPREFPLEQVDRCLSTIPASRIGPTRSLPLYRTGRTSKCGCGSAAPGRLWPAAPAPAPPPWRRFWAVM